MLYTICIDQSTMHNIYFIGQADKPHWFGWGQTKGELMIEHGIPRFGSDYNKARMLWLSTPIWVFTREFL